MVKAIVNRVGQELRRQELEEIKPPEYHKNLLNGDIWLTIINEVQFVTGTKLSMHPLESGSDISDHKSDIPDVINLKGALISDETEPDENWIDKREKIYNLKNSDEVVSLLARSRFYYNYQVTSFVTTETNEIGNGCEFTMTLTRVNISTSQTEIIPDSAIPIAAKKRINGGKKATNQISDDEYAKIKDKN